MKKLVLIAFAAISAALIVALLMAKPQGGARAGVARSRVVIPKGGSESQNPQENFGQDGDAALTTLIALMPDETLVSAFSADFDGDGLDEQFAAVKRRGGREIVIIAGIYNEASKKYDRAAEIQTGISDAVSFTCAALDLTGEHRNALVYQGIAEDGNSVLDAYLCSGRGANFALKDIASFKSDGTIFIQQVDRYDSYELSQSKGVSFPIWVYSSGAESPGGILYQVQTQYNWNPAEQRYTQTQQLHVEGSSLAARELAKIQDGTVKSFANFLDGLWYKTDSRPDHIRYIFFDWQNKEIIFLQDDSEEVYSWTSSSLRRNGIYLSMDNASIQNLQRRFDVSLVSLDEVRVRIQDDLRMIINESNLWDGGYKKVSGASAQEDSGGRAKAVLDLLKEGPVWYSADGTSYSFYDGICAVTRGTAFDSAGYAIAAVRDSVYVQFRDCAVQGALCGAYEFSLAEQDKRRPDDSSMLLLRPVQLTPRGGVASEREPVFLTRGDQKF